jgi:acylphosphatase
MVGKLFDLRKGTMLIIMKAGSQSTKMSEAKRVRIRIHGRVQGVFYRHNAAQKAERFGVKGWVRNHPDGSVEALLEGKEQAIQQMIKWCKEGPSGAIVEKMDLTWEPYKGEFHNFQIRY